MTEHNQAKDLQGERPLLFPKPQMLERIGGLAPIAFPLRINAGPLRAVVEPMLRAGGFADIVFDGKESQIRLSLDRALGKDKSEEGYRIAIRERETPAITVTAGTLAGLRNGAATLAQLLRQYGERVPALNISDAPALATRGAMLDISRDRVPTMEHLREIVNTLALLKCNHLQLYTEHTFAYAGHEDVWRDASPMTGAEYETLDGWCRELGIVLAANQNCFGHLAAWLNLPRYLPLAEIDSQEKTWKFMEWERPGPFSLCPIDPRSHELVRDMLDQLLPHFSSKLANINCDETFDVGQGRSAGDVVARGRAEVYFDFVHKVVSEVRKHGFKPMFWADIALSHPDRLGMAPSDLLALAWGYEPDSDFDKWGHTLKHSGREFWVCPGTSSWRSIVGRTVERRGNIDGAVKAGTRHGATGMLVTDWGDLGHRQQWPVSLHGLADGLNSAWTGEGGGGDLSAESLQVFGDRNCAAATWLEDMGEIDKVQKQIFGRPGEDGKPTRLKNASALLQDSTLVWNDTWKPGSAGLWRESAAAAQWLEAKVPGGAGELMRQELAFTAMCARVLCERAAARRESASAQSSELASNLVAVRAGHEQLWKLRSRPGGMAKSSAHYTRLIEEFGAGTRG
ncbi:MAG: family 20 glycosylhydrolase [Planctomycetes bacterium]|nr:family 20 glycosylhydrolase [Planctomycetota bacterium]